VGVEVTTSIFLDHFDPRRHESNSSSCAIPPLGRLLPAVTRSTTYDERRLPGDQGVASLEVGWVPQLHAMMALGDGGSKSHSRQAVDLGAKCGR
jgi:hypothetical protein